MRITSTATEMNEKRQAALSRKLEELAGSGGNDRSDLIVEVVPDLMDHLTRAADHDLAVDRLNRNAQTLQDVRAALSAIESGDYGICQECEEVIPSKRLDAIPWARYCVRCQEAADQAQRSSHPETFRLSEAA